MKPCLRKVVFGFGTVLLVVVLNGRERVKEQLTPERDQHQPVVSLDEVLVRPRLALCVVRAEAPRDVHLPGYQPFGDHELGPFVFLGNLAELDLRDVLLLEQRRLTGLRGRRLHLFRDDVLDSVASRAQMLLQLAGLTITVTGFSGASIARSGRLAAILAELEARKLRHDPTELITRAVQPALWLLVFGQVFTRVHAIPTGNLPYIDFMAPGILAQSVLFIAIFYGIAIIWERDLGITNMFLASPASREALVLGKALSAGLRQATSPPGPTPTPGRSGRRSP